MAGIRARTGAKVPVKYPKGAPVAPSKARQRALARAKLERQIARRAAVARRRRQWRAGIGGALALALVVLGGIWLAGGFKPTPKKAADCAWTKDDAASNVNLKDVGQPPTTGVKNIATKIITITTNQGVLSGILDGGKSPCTVASMNYLAGKQFFDNTKCHRLTTSGIFVLQCGDPSGTGQGGPAYHFKNEFVPPPNGPAADPSASAAPSATPTQSTAIYPRGTLALAHSAQPDSNGSQFFMVYKDSPLPPDYTIFGNLTTGLEVLDKIAAGGVAPPAGDNGAGTQTDGAPKIETTIQSLTVTDTAPTAPAPTTPPSAPPSTTPTQTATP
jgi:peptidyl-prolyl cis-trans isomerase B (cyclophilin B)